VSYIYFLFYDYYHLSKKKELRLSVWSLPYNSYKHDNNDDKLITKKNRTLTQTFLSSFTHSSNTSSLIANPDHIFLSPA
jgi:hypothetical protein